MGTTENKQPIEKLNTMKKIADRGNYSIWEKDNKQYELILFTSSDKDFKEEEKIVEALKANPFQGLVIIDTIQISTTDKWHGKTNCLHVLTDHPKFTLQDYLNRNTQLENHQIVNLVLHIAGAQLMLGAKKQYIGFNNIYTSDGKDWKLKPFEATQSFYSIYKENRKKIGTTFEMSGFPAPEEIKKQVVDHDRVSIFGFGMIILQLIGKQKSQDIYNKKEKGINEQLLQERINLLQQQKSNFSGDFIAIVIDMLDIDLTRRPNYQQLVDKIRAPTSKISINNIKGFSQVSVIQRLINQDSAKLFNQQSLVQTEQIRIIEAVSVIDEKINHGLSTVRSKLIASTTKKQKINEDGTVFEGELSNGVYQGEGKITLKNGHVLFEGEFDKGNYVFGTLNFENPIQLKKSYQFDDCRDIFKYALRYEGKFQNNKKHGEGRVILTNGETFWGDFKNDQIDGNGQFCRMDQSQVYGLWVNGIMHSTPGFPNQMSSFPSPSQMQSINNVPDEISNFNQDPAKQPQGQISYTNMPKLQRDITLSQISDIKSSIENSMNKLKLTFSKRQSQIEGETLYYDKEKQLKKYQGDHQKGVMHGAGTLYFADGETLQYVGEFQNDLFHGFGTLNNQNPVETTEIDVKDLRDIQIHGWWNSYDGFFMKGKKTGQGRLSLTNGGCYFGLFEQDQIHGIGSLTCPNKQDLYARWENGELKEVIVGSL